MLPCAVNFLVTGGTNLAMFSVFVSMQELQKES